MPELFTIGHSSHSAADFMSLLERHNVTAIADVRSHPYSRYNAELPRIWRRAPIPLAFTAS